MDKIKTITFISLLLFNSIANATLINRGNGMIYDSGQDITWLADANYAMTSGYDLDGVMTWGEANAWASQLIYEGFTDWRLPTTPFIDISCSDTTGNAKGYNCTLPEMASLFYSELGGAALNSISTLHNSKFDLFSNIQVNPVATIYWYGTQAPPPDNIDKAWFFFFSTGDQDYSYKDLDGYAWAVHDGDIGLSVPEPSTYLLLLSGLIVLRRKQNK
ncbi:MAG: DUF1566 domain-containing protein [Candidatus Brocadiales bacterium]|nr:DUF1566 domain-containing protein [Candidatus Brocadiales bacterium]